MSKRPAIDLAALTSEQAAPMPEATQRAARPTAIAAPEARTERPERPERPARPPTIREGRTPTAELKPLAFKVPPAFRKRFKQQAASAELKLNELLFEAMDAWEEKRGFKK